MQQKLIRFDWAMKRLLRNKANFDILEGFLSELIGEDITILQLLESESNRESYQDKQNRVDLLAENSQKELLFIEVQNEKEHDYLQRVLFGTSKIINEHMEKGMEYSEVRKVYSVSIVYFDLGQGDDYVYCGQTNFVGKHTGTILQLNKEQKKLYGEKQVYQVFPEYFVIKVNNFDNVAKDTLDEWIYFLKNEVIKPEFRAKGIQKAKQEFEIMKLSLPEQKAYDRYLGDLSYLASMHESTYKLGFIEGREAVEIEKEELRQALEAEKQRLQQEAEAKERVLIEQAEAKEKALIEQAEAEKYAFHTEIAKKCLQMGMSIEQAAQMSGFSIEEIQKMLENPN